MYNNLFGDVVSNFKFSIVMFITDMDRIFEQSIESILKQTIGFKDNIQLIFINNNCQDNSLNICRDYQRRYPDNIVIIDEENPSRNLAFDYIDAEYVNFFNIHERYSDNALKEIYSFFKKYDDLDIVTVPMYNLESDRPHKLNAKFNLNVEVIDLIENPTKIHPFLNSSFIRKETLSNHRFNDDLLIQQESNFIYSIFMDNPKFGLLKKNNVAYYYMIPTEQFPESLDENPLKREILESFIYDYCSDLIDRSVEKYGCVPEFIQSIMVYEICKICFVKELRDIYDEQERKQFMKALLNILSLIDETSIYRTPHITFYQKRFLVFLKHNDFSICIDEENNLNLMCNEYYINILNKKPIIIDYVEKKQGFLNINGYFRSNSYNECISVEAIKKSGANTTVFEGKFNDYETYRPNMVFMDIAWEFYYNFDFNIPLGDDEDCDVKLRLNFQEGDVSYSFYPELKFSTYCNLSVFSHYYVKDNKIVIFRNNSIDVIPFSFKKMLRLESRSVFKIFRTSRKPQFMYSLFIRLLFFLAYPFMRNRRIWLFSDRPEHADDNAKHLFSYCVDNDDGVEKYFVVDKNVPDYKVMKGISKNVLGFKTLKNKIYYLYAEKIIVSHIIDKFANPLAYRNKALYCGLASSDKYFLQHGVIEGDLSDRLNKPMRNLAMFLTSADMERDSIIYNHNYNFKPERVPALGLPRFDTLTNEDVKKQILFIPTWRSYIKGEESLINSEYYIQIKNLLNNERLLKKLEQTGYKFIFKLHPEMYPYAEYFKSEHENVIISEAEYYQEFFNKSSVLITDYSTVAFDFSYLKKPVIYYQYADEYHYNKGYFDFDELGFGDLITTEEDLIDKIFYYIDNDCKMEDKYVNRVETFFKHTDKNNRKRVYEWILNDE